MSAVHASSPVMENVARFPWHLRYVIILTGVGAGGESGRGDSALGVKMKVKALALILPLAFALPAVADEVVLRNGAILSGIVREEGDKVVLQLDFGTMTFGKSDVRSVRKSDDPLKEFEQRLASATNAKSTFELATWAREKGLTSRSNELLRKGISLDPAHEGARRAP